jgi:hypothetical protein
MLPTGPSFVMNGTGRPEPVGHDLKQPVGVRVYIGNQEITKHIRVVAEDVVNESQEFADGVGRMR